MIAVDWRPMDVRSLPRPGGPHRVAVPRHPDL